MFLVRLIHKAGNEPYLPFFCIAANVRYTNLVEPPCKWFFPPFLQSRTLGKALLCG